MTKQSVFWLISKGPEKDYHALRYLSKLVDTKVVHSIDTAKFDTATSAEYRLLVDADAVGMATISGFCGGWTLS